MTKMKVFNIKTKTKRLLADTLTPVSIFLKIRDVFPNSLLLESSDYRGNENSYSFICMQPIASFIIENKQLTYEYPGADPEMQIIEKPLEVPDKLQSFVSQFKTENDKESVVNGFFGYTAFDGVRYFENIQLGEKRKEEHSIPEMRYSFYKYIIAINHFKNEMVITENLTDGDCSKLEEVEVLLRNRNFATYSFNTEGEENSNITDQEFMNMVGKGKEHCFLGDVFQIVLSRQFSRAFKGDEFNVYRALRSVNPSPYLFYFDYGTYKLFGSSPEAQLTIKNNLAGINPIAGTFKRTGDESSDREAAKALVNDPKENAEHVMLVDLARNDLARNSTDVKVETYREVQYYSHVIHLVSKVTGKLGEKYNPVRVLADSFPAGTLSGAPKYKAMELIEKYENQNRGFYGGCIGLIGLDGDLNHAIMIRSFLSKGNTLYYQAGAGIVSESKEESELNEVNNKLGALKTAIEMAQKI